MNFRCVCRTCAAGRLRYRLDDRGGLLDHHRGGLLHDDDSPENLFPGVSAEVCGIIADSPIDTLPSYLRNVLDRDKFISTEAALYRLRMLTKARFGFDMNVCDCAVHAGRIRVPVLLFEGGEDDVTPPRGANDIYDNLRSRKRMVVVNDAKHLQCYENSQALYEREVQKFIESCLIRLVKLGLL